MFNFPTSTNLSGILKTTGLSKPNAVSGLAGTVAKLSKFVPVYGQVASFAASIVGKETIAKTIGAALKYGIKCWGASWNPDRAAKELPMFLDLIAERYKAALSVRPEQLESSLNKFFQDFHTVNHDGRPLTQWLHWRHSSAKDCTLKGLIVLENGINTYLKECADGSKTILQQASIDSAITKTAKTTLVTSGRSNYAYPTYKVSISIPAGYFDAVKPVSTVGKTAVLPDNSGVTPPPAKSGNSAATTIIGGIVAAILFKKFFK